MLIFKRSLGKIITYQHKNLLMVLRKTFIASILFFLILDVDAQTYKGTQAGKVLRNWYVTGPIKVSADSSRPDVIKQQDFFNRKDDQNISVSFKTTPGTNPDLKNWKKVNEKNDIIDFDSIFNRQDFASAYAYAVIESADARPAMLAIGSDDALKVWHNGKLVHKNWIPRGIVPDNDIVPLSLVKGKNELLIEVQDMEGGWGFTARFLDEKGLTSRLVKSAAAGNVDEAKRMIEYGAQVNAKGENGQTPLDAARINGREEI